MARSAAGVDWAMAEGEKPTLDSNNSKRIGAVWTRKLLLKRAKNCIMDPRAS